MVDDQIVVVEAPFSLFFNLNQWKVGPINRKEGMGEYDLSEEIFYASSMRNYFVVS